MCLNFCDIVFQTWDFEMPKHKNIHFCPGIIPKYSTCTHHSYQYRFLQYVWQCCGKL